VKKIFCILAVVFAAGTVVFAATYTVGAGKTYSTIKGLTSTKTLSPGDIVEIYPGTYNEGVYWPSANKGTVSSPIIVRGMGLIKPVIDGTGLSLTGAPPSGTDSLFMVYSENIVFENLEFKNGGVSDGGSAIRLQGGSNNITVRNCKISHCGIGISSSTAAVGTLIVENTEIANCLWEPTDGSTHWGHNVYLQSDSIFRYCYIHDSGKGNNFKSRGHYTELWYNYIADANSIEVDLVESTNTTAANSNAVLVGNIIIKRNAAPKSGYAGNDVQFIMFGRDGGEGGAFARNGTMYLLNNTIIAGMAANKFLDANSSAKYLCSNNIFYGSNTMTTGFTNAITGSNNWIPSGAAAPSGFSGTLQGTDPSFINAVSRDYHLTAASAVINKGINNPSYLDGSGASHSGVPAYEYLAPVKSVARNSDGQLDLGAFEYGSGGGGGGGTVDPFANVKTYPNPFRLSISADKMIKLNNIPAGASMDIFDINGSKIRSLKEGNAGISSMILWDGKNEGGDSVPSGTYMYTLLDGAGNKKKGKIALLK